MQLSSVQYGDGIGFSIRSDADKAALASHLRDNFGIRCLLVQQQKQQQQQRYSAKAHARELRRGGQWVASFRPIGIPAFLLLTRRDGCGLCIVIERRVADGHFYPRMTLVRLTFAPDVFDGVAIEGDVVRVRADGTGGTRTVFLASDVHCDRTRDRCLALRLSLLHALVTPPLHLPDIASDVFSIRVRQNAPAAHLTAIVSQQVLVPGWLDYDIGAVVFRHLTDADASSVVFSVPKETAAAVAANGGNNSPAAPDGEDGSAAGTRTRPTTGSNIGDNGSTTDTDSAHTDCDNTDSDSDSDIGTDSGRGLMSANKEEDDSARPPLRLFYVRPTAVPDVYELYDSEDGARTGAAGAEIAAVPSLRASRAMRDACSSRPTLSPPAIMFEYSRRFRRWLPLLTADGLVQHGVQAGGADAVVDEEADKARAQVQEDEREGYEGQQHELGQVV